MLNFAADFWPAFWTILGVAAAVTAVVCFSVAVVPLPGTRRHHQPPAWLHPHRPTHRPPRAQGLPRTA